MSLMVIQRHRNWCQAKAIRDFLLVFHCNYMSLFYHFRDIAISKNLCLFAIIHLLQSRLKPSQEYSPLTYCTKFSLKKYSPWATR